MIVAINATSAKMGGALTYLLNLVSELERYGDTHRFFVFASDGIELPPSTDTVRISSIPAAICDSPMRLFWWQQWTLPSILKKYSCDLLFSTANFATLLCPCPQILLIRIPHYFSDEYLAHILPKKSFKEKVDFRLRRLLIMLSASRASAVFFPSHAMQDGFIKHCFNIAKKSSVNHYGVPIKKFERCRAVRMSSDQLRILCTSHYSDYKNYTTLLRALIELKNRTVHCTFTAPINLDLPLFSKLFTCKDDRGLIHALNMQEYGHEAIKLLGPVPYSALPDLYADAGIFVWPSLSESFGHPLFEAMAAGLPIVCSDIPVNRELCGDAALYVPPLDPCAWASTIHTLANDKDLQEQLRFAGRKKLLNYRWEDHVTRLIRLFEHEQNLRSHSDKK